MNVSVMVKPRSMARQLGVIDTEELPTRTEARAVWVAWREARGVWASPNLPLLTAPDHNVKLAKSSVPTYGLSLAPADESGFEVCPNRTPLCTRGCLATAGKGTLDKVRRGRVLKAQFLADHPREFLVMLTDELTRAAVRHDGILCRLNVLSDLPWERIAPSLFTIAGVRFYDYTKSRKRAALQPYHLTYSASERTSDAAICDLLDAGVSVAAVFPKVPATWHGRDVVNGDETDDRTIDAPGSLIALKAKGRMRDHKQYAGFVRTL